MQLILKNVLQHHDDSLKELQERQSLLIRAEKVTAIGILTSGMDLKISNPLTACVTFAMDKTITPSKFRADNCSVLL